MSEHEPAIRIPAACAGLLLLIFGVQLVQSVGGFDLSAYGVQPNEFLTAPFTLPHLGTLITYQFIHAGWMHAGVNGMMLLAFGSAMARMMDAWKFVLLYLGFGVVAALVHVFAYPDRLGYLIGASGAISGAMGFVLWHAIRHPAERLRMMLVIIITQPILALAGGALLGGEIAWLAHIAGFVGGMIAALWYKGRI